MNKFLLISILVHLLFFGIILFNPPVFGPKKIKVTTISPSQLLQIRKAMSGQLVKTKNVDSQEEIPDTKYLSEKNQVVKNQTQSTNVDAFREKKTKGDQKKRITLSDLAVPSVTGGMARIKKSHDQSTDGTKADRNQDAASMDDLEGVKKGDETSLSTREFVYFSFYNRIHEKIEMLWPPILRDKLAAMEKKRIVSSRETVDIVVVMNKKGVIEQVEVLERSRLHELDDSAVEAFNRAGPFFNPPAGIADPDGLIRMRWGFTLYTGSLTKYAPPN